MSRQVDKFWHVDRFYKFDNTQIGTYVSTSQVCIRVCVRACVCVKWRRIFAVPVKGILSMLRHITKYIHAYTRIHACKHACMYASYRPTMSKSCRWANIEWRLLWLSLICQGQPQLQWPICFARYKLLIEHQRQEAEVTSFIWISYPHIWSHPLSSYYLYLLLQLM